VLIIQTLIVFVLVAIFVQDLKSRAVYWFWFPVLVCLFSIDGYFVRHQLIRMQWLSASIDLLFIGAQLLLVSLYFSIKQRQWVNISRELLGWGDILFLVSIAFYFSILNYLLFYISSLIIICVFVLLCRIFSVKNNQQIPLAGLQALILIVFLVVQLLDKNIDLTSDNWLLHYLYR